MARGWESKSVESQIEDAQRRRQSKPPSQGQIDRETQRSGLLLSRARVLHDLQVARHPRHQKQLREALAFLDGKLGELDK